MNLLSFFKPRERIRTRAITFADIFEKRPALAENDVFFAFGTPKNYASLHIGIGTLNDTRH